MTIPPATALPLRTDRPTQISAPGPGSVRGVYTLQEGETLRAVAERYGVSGQALLAVNPQLDLRRPLPGGTPINIPAAVPAPTSSPRAFDVPDAPPITTVPGTPGGLQPPSTTGVQLGRTPARTFFSDPRTQALPPQPMTWPRPERPLTLGARNPEVEIIQRALNRIGYSLKVDGELGQGTVNVIASFQQLVGLSPSGVMTPDTWSRLRSAMEAVRQPQTVLVRANRDTVQTQDERNAYDILLALAYDEPGTDHAQDMGLRGLMRALNLPLGTPPTITDELVTAFAQRAMALGLPLNDASLAPLDPMRLDTTSDRMNYNQARSVSEMLTRKARGSRIDTAEYDRFITYYARQYGLEPEMVKAIMCIESNFNPRDPSHVGAQGLMQVMPDTAAYVGIPDVSTDARNIEAGVKYLSILSRQFRGDLVYIAAGYNSGPNRVARNGGVPPIQETYDYVRRFLSHYAYYRQHPVRT